LSLTPLLDFYTRFIFVVVILGIWFLLLSIGYLLDIQRERIALLKDICQGDCYVRKWSYFANIKADGSALVRRQVYGINYAPTRRKFEFETWIDYRHDASEEEEIKKQSGMKVDVTVIQAKKSPLKLYSSQEIDPEFQSSIRFIRSIPIAETATKQVDHLVPGDEFIIDLENTSPKGTWLCENGDRYIHRITHLTETMHVELLLPKEWKFPIKSTENAAGYRKAPTLGVWERTDEQPKIEHGNKIVWDVKYPRLMHSYKLEYCKMGNTVRTIP
jgi:hypothetical protein